MSIERAELERMKESGELIGKYVRDPNHYFKGNRIKGRVTKVKSIEERQYHSSSVVTINTTHESNSYVEGIMGSDRFGKYIGSRYGVRIYLEKEWKKSCASCASRCKRRNRCALHSDDSVVVER